MGTRNLVFIFYRGRFVVAQYGQWDGYPEGQGFKIFEFLQDLANIERLKEGLQHIYTPSKEQLQKIKKEIVRLDKEAREEGLLYSFEYVAAINKYWPFLSRDTGARILEIIAESTAEKRVPIQLNLEFANDGYCEWAYVVDLDGGIFEVFSGLEQKCKAASQRFNDIGGEDDCVPALVKSFSFAELRITKQEFIAALNKVFEERKRERLAVDKKSRSN
jgi:hypothetical protein